MYLTTTPGLRLDQSQGKNFVVGRIVGKPSLTRLGKSCP
jgi:hypothetical protein